MGPTVLKVDRNLATRRATEVCNYIAARAGEAVSIKAVGKTTKVNSSKYRRVLVNLVY